ncbi:MAG TPA: phosphodiester glycosidase family protein [Coleofasciculaceae cyanobacterium]
MKLAWIVGLAFVGLEAALFYVSTSSSAIPPTPAPQAATSPTASPIAQPIRYEVRSLPQSEVHLLTIPAGSPYRVMPALSEGVATLKDFAAPAGAIAVINGGFFDPANQQSTSHVTLDGKSAADPKQNDRLTQNPDLAPYLDKIFNRSEFRQYLCNSEGSPSIRYDVALHSDAPLANCQLASALGAGPRLLPDLNLQPESFLEVADGTVIRDPIDHNRLSPRSAIGILPDGGLVWVMVAQKAGAIEASGMTLQQLADFIKSLGAVKALNLDGGGSASLYYNGTTYYGTLDAQGNPIERPVKSVLLVK